VQSCAVADQGLKRLLGFGNVPTEKVIDAVTALDLDPSGKAARERLHRIDVGARAPVALIVE
jgi:hypothetical protein